MCHKNKCESYILNSCPHSMGSSFSPAAKPTLFTNTLVIMTCGNWKAIINELLQFNGHIYPAPNSLLS